MRLRDLERALRELLDVDSFADAQPNGLQVEGRDEVRHVVGGVSACEGLFRFAADRRADAILTHHGMFWDRDPRPILGMQRRRLKLLLDHDVSLLSYHLPLDAHQALGNNALGCRALGMSEFKPFAAHGGKELGWFGRLPRPHAPDAFAGELARIYGAPPKVFGRRAGPIGSVGVVSGAAADDVAAAAERGLDAFVTGEPNERLFYAATELGMQVFACGHHATERLGVKALGAHLHANWGLEFEFWDAENPI
ncbi:MAG: Nif3-like dinuclear metal center hexameric protein [Thermoplasmatota archaeon]